MNEKLKQEIKDYWLNIVTDNHAVESISLSQFNCACEHFYNLALKEVKEEMKSRADKLHNEPLPQDRETLLLKMCKENAFREVILFIDKLTK